MFTNGKQLAAVIGSFFMTIAPVIKMGYAATNSWHFFVTGDGISAVLVAVGGWFIAMSTYSFFDKPIGTPEAQK